MFKRFLALVTVLCAVTLCCAVPVNAAFYWEEEFSDGLPAFALNLNPSSGSYSCEIVDGALYAEGMNSGGNIARGLGWTGTEDSSSSLVVQFDLKWDNWNVLTDDTRILVYVFAGDNRRILHSILPHKYWFNNGSNSTKVSDTAMQDKEWYTFTYCFSPDKTKVDVYRQKTNSDEAPTLLIGNYTTEIKNMPGSVVNLYFPKATAAYFDNVKAYNGRCLADGGFEADGEPLMSVNEVTDGTITAISEVVDSDLFGTTKSVETLLMAFDENNMMVECLFGGSQDITGGKNVVEAEFNTATFADKIQNGQLKFCVWKDLMSARPIVEPVVLGQ